MGYYCIIYIPGDFDILRTGKKTQQQNIRCYSTPTLHYFALFNTKLLLIVTMIWMELKMRNKL